MAIIRKLITREWLTFFFSSLALLMILLSVGNLVSGFLRGNISPSAVMLGYFIQIPNFLTQAIPVSCLVASLFSINKLKNRNELTAIFASGYSRQSYLTDLLSIGLYIAVAQFLISAYIDPMIKSKRHRLLNDDTTMFRNLKSQGLRASTIGSGKIWYKSDKYYFSFTHFNSRTNTIHDPTIYYFDTNYHMKEILKTNKLTYHSLKEEWVSAEGKSYSNLNFPSFPFINNTKSSIVLNEKLSDFKQIEADITTLSFFNLYKYIKQLNQSGINVGEYLVIFYKHISDSLICIIFTLLAAIPIFNPNRRNSSFGKSASFVFVFTITYWLVQSYFIELGKNLKVNAIVSCFTIPSIFIIFLILVFLQNRKLA